MLSAYFAPISNALVYYVLDTGSASHLRKKMPLLNHTREDLFFYLSEAFMLGCQTFHFQQILVKCEMRKSSINAIHKDAVSVHTCGVSGFS